MKKPDDSSDSTATPDVDETPDHVLPLEGNKKIYLKERFPSRWIVEFQENAPELADEFMGIWETDDDLDEVEREQIESLADQDDVGEEEIQEVLEAQEEMRQFRAEERFQRKGMLMHLKVNLDQLTAWHEFTARMIDDVEGYTDAEGDDVVWKHYDDQAKIDWVDMELSSTVKLTIFMYAYTQKAGLS